MNAEPKAVDVVEYTGSIQFRGAKRNIPVRGYTDKTGMMITGQGIAVSIKIDLARQGDYLAGFLEISTERGAMPIAAIAKIDGNDLFIQGFEFDGHLSVVGAEA